MNERNPTAVLSFRSLDEQVAAALTQERLVATLAGFFGILGLLLAAVGLYGVTSYAVTSRRAEIGIRMALGASAGGVVALVLRRVAWLVALGIVLGAGLSVWAAKFVATLLYGLDARDPATFAWAAALLMLVAALAAWLPARRRVTDRSHARPPEFVGTAADAATFSRRRPLLRADGPARPPRPAGRVRGRTRDRHARQRRGGA